MRFNDPKGPFNCPTVKTLSTRKLTAPVTLVNDRERMTDKAFREQYVKDNPKALRIPTRSSKMKGK